MSIVVEHDKRKKEILERALDVFTEEGYEDTTFRKIAERCGITRTILYLYFKNKREIFSFSIKQFTVGLEVDIRDIAGQTDIPYAGKLAQILDLVLARCSEQRRLLTVIFRYLDHLHRSGGDPDERVRRRTIRMRHILSTVIIEGIKAGEFRRLSVRAATDLMYSLIEAAIFRIVILGKQDASTLLEPVRLAVESLARAAGKATDA